MLDGSNYSHLFSFSGANKAGMESVDKEKQAQIIYEMSKHSAYFKKAEKQDEIAAIKANQIFQLFDNIKQGSLNELNNKKNVDRFCLDIERRRNFSRICCVLDMDMFFAAVEIRDQPHLKDLPVAVGSNSMISTANYIARKYGVRSAMPGFIAKKIMPTINFC